MTMFEDEGIISNVFAGTVGKETQKQRKRARNKKKLVSWLEKKSFAEAAKLIPVKVESRRDRRLAEDK